MVGIGHVHRHAEQLGIDQPGDLDHNRRGRDQQWVVDIDRHDVRFLDPVIEQLDVGRTVERLGSGNHRRILTR
jgi:hypothetical protein